MHKGRQAVKTISWENAKSSLYIPVNICELHMIVIIKLYANVQLDSLRFRGKKPPQN